MNPKARFVKVWLWVVIAALASLIFFYSIALIIKDETLNDFVTWVNTKYLFYILFATVIITIVLGSHFVDWQTKRKKRSRNKRVVIS